MQQLAVGRCLAIAKDACWIMIHPNCLACTLQELIGHCTAVYNSNRTATLALEQHLSQYGYQRPEETVQEPENPEKLMQDAGGWLVCLYVQERYLAAMEGCNN